MYKLLAIFCTLLCLSIDSNAQEWSLTIFNHNEPEAYKPLRYEDELKDSLSTLQEIQYYIVRLHEASYLEAAMDSIVYQKNNVEAFVHIGSRHHWSQLQSGNVPDEYLFKSGYKQKFYSQTHFSYKELASLESRIIRYSENNGFPFARIGLDSIACSDSYFSATLNYQAGPLIRFDTIALVGDARVKRKYLESYLGLKEGGLYDQQKVKNLERQLKQIQYIKVTKSPEVFFSNGQAQPVLYVSARKCNQLDGYLGLQPNTNGKMLFTGEFNMKLKNLFHSGKELTVQWKRFDVQSQLLKTSYYHPRLFRSNLDCKFIFNFLKQDTSYVISDRSASIYLAINSTSKFRFFTGLKSNTSFGGTRDDNPQGVNQDFKYFNYGVGYTLNTLDDIFYPMDGWDVTIDVSTGKKEILNYVPIGSEDIPVNSVQWTLEGEIGRFLRIGKKATLLNHLQGGIVQSDNLVLSDLYRVGGLKSLRGFNENNYYTSDYATYTLEYRYFTDESSYVLLFANQGYIVNKLNNNYTDWPIGFGTGISFSTKAGIFQFIYAMGYAKDQPLSLNLSKIHFGLVSRF